MLTTLHMVYLEGRSGKFFAGIVCVALPLTNAAIILQLPKQESHSLTTSNLYIGPNHCGPRVNIRSILCTTLSRQISRSSLHRAMPLDIQIRKDIASVTTAVGDLRVVQNSLETES